MIPLQEAFEIMQAQAASPRGERVSIMCAIGRVCHRSIYSSVSTPGYDSSAMDGYAVDSTKTQGATASNPCIFELRGSLYAGDRQLQMYDNKIGCVEIATGSPFPDGFDACVRLEDVQSFDSDGLKRIAVCKAVPQNANRRWAGQDFREDDLVVRAGSVIRSQDVMALTAIGEAEIEVRKNPSIAIISTGSELVPYDEVVGKGQIRDSNGPFLVAALQELGLKARYLGIIKDDLDGLVKQISFDHDVVIATGSVSKGKHDFLREGLEKLGCVVHFHGVAMRPGKPVLFATKGASVIFGLPGNPMATAATFRMIVVPFLRILLGLPAEHAAQIQAQEFHKTSFDVFHHGNMHGDVAAFTEDQSSGKIRPWLSADRWIQSKAGGISILPIVARLW